MSIAGTNRKLFLCACFTAPVVLATPIYTSICHAGKKGSLTPVGHLTASRASCFQCHNQGVVDRSTRTVLVLAVQFRQASLAIETVLTALT